MNRDRGLLTNEECTALLITGLQSQDPTVLPCMASYSPALKFQLKRRFGNYLSDEDLDDVIMDASIRVFLKGPKFDPALATVPTWLYRHAVYCAWTLLQSRLNAIPLDKITEKRRSSIERFAEAPTKPSPEIEKILQRLPERQADIIRLYYFEGWPVEEIADLYGYKPVTVRSVLSRARKNIREFMEGHKDSSN